MTESQFEFGATENKHFTALANLSVLSCVALVVYALANASYLFNVVASGKVALMVRTLDDAFMTAAALFAAYQLNLAAKSFRKIVNTQGNDVGLLNLSNRRLRLVFTSLAIMFVLMAIRFILDYSALMLWIQAA